MGREGSGGMVTVEGWWRIRELGAAGRGGVSNTKDWSGAEQMVGGGAHRGRGAGVSGEKGGRGRERREVGEKVVVLWVGEG